MATSGTKQTNTEYDSYFWVSWSQSSQSIQNNTTTINWSCGVYCGHSFYSNAIQMSAVTINGTKVYSGGTYSNYGPGDHTISSGSLTITHSSDGTKTFKIAKFTGWLYESHNYSASESSYTLTPISRLSSLSALDGTLGTEQNLTITRASTSFKHSITYDCGDVHRVITTYDTRTTIPFTPPLTLASQNTSGKSVSVTYTLYTISGETVLGTTTKTVTYTIPSSIHPSVSSGWATVSYYNTGTGASSIAAFVKGFSKAQVTFDSSKISTSGCYGATIASYKIVFNGTTITASPYRTATLTEAGTLTVRCYVIDTRGYSAYQDLTFSVNDYVNPTLSNIEVFRCDSSGTPSTSGTYISVKAKANISSIGGLNSFDLEARYGPSSGSYGNYFDITDNVANIIGNGLVSVTNTYNLEIRLLDALSGSATHTAVIQTDKVSFNLRDGGDGAAFGKYSESDEALELASGWVIKLGNTTLSEAQLQALLNLL